MRNHAQFARRSLGEKIVLTAKGREWWTGMRTRPGNPMRLQRQPHVSWRSGHRGQQPFVMGRWSPSGTTTAQAPGHPPAGLALARATASAAHGLAGRPRRHPAQGAACPVRGAAASGISGGLGGGGGWRVTTAVTAPAMYLDPPESRTRCSLRLLVELAVHSTMASSDLFDTRMRDAMCLRTAGMSRCENPSSMSYAACSANMHTNGPQST